MGVGVGIGLDVGVIERSTTAHVDQGAHVTAGNGDILVKAESNDDITSIAATFGLSTSNTGVAASISVMVLLTDTKAYTGGAVQLTATDGNISITADGNLTALMIGGSVGAGSTAGVGIANTTLVHEDTVEAYIGPSANIVANGGTGLSLSATSAEDIDAVAVAGGGAGTVGVAGSVTSRGKESVAAI